MAEIRGLHSHNFFEGNEELIAVWKTATIHRIGNSWRRGPGIQLTNDTDAYMSSFLDEVFLTNGVDANWNYDGSIWTQTNNVSGSPIGKFNTVLGPRIFLLNVKINGVSYPRRVWYSDLPGVTLTWGFESGTDLTQTAGSNEISSSSALFRTRNIKVGDPFFITSGANAGQYTVQSLGDSDGDNRETTILLTEELENSATNSSYWVGSNWFDTETNMSDEGMGLGVTSNEVFVFLQNSVHRFNVTSRELRRVKNAPGTTSSRSILSDGGYVWWYHPSGIYRTSGSQEELMTNPIEDIIDGVSNQTEVVGWINKNENTVNFYLGDVTLRDGETISKCVVSFDTNSEAWFTRSYDKPIKVATEWLKDSVPEVYVGDDSNGVHHWDYGTDFNGAEIPFALETQWIFPMDPQTFVDFDRIRSFVENGPDVQINFKLCYRPMGDEQNWSVDKDWTPLIGSQGSDQSEWKFPRDSRAAGVKLQVIESSGDKSFLMEKVVIYYSNPSSY